MYIKLCFTIGVVCWFFVLCVLFCFQAPESCYSSTLQNGKLLICFGLTSCAYPTIINVSTIIALGDLSLEHTKIYNADIIYLLGYKSGSDLTIFDDDPNTIVYCFSTECDNINTQLYCYDYSYYYDYDYDLSVKSNIIPGTQICYLLSPSPTYIPTLYPTIYPTYLPSTKPTLPQLQKDINRTISFLENGTVILAILMFVVSIVLIMISKRMRNNKKSEDDLPSFNNKSGRMTIVDYKTGYGKSSSDL